MERTTRAANVCRMGLRQPLDQIDVVIGKMPMNIREQRIMNEQVCSNCGWWEESVEPGSSFSRGRGCCWCDPCEYNGKLTAPDFSCPWWEGITEMEFMEIGP